jgi:hypothetical protein
MEVFIYENINVISDILTNEILDIFKNTKLLYLTITQYIENDKWNKIYKFLLNELIYNIEKYKIKINKPQYTKDYNNIDYDILDNSNKQFSIENVIITHYLRELNNCELNHFYNGYNLIKINMQNKTFSKLRFIFCLSGSSEQYICFWNSYSIKLEPGKIIIFPSEWLFSYKFVNLTEENIFIIGYINTI